MELVRTNQSLQMINKQDLIKLYDQQIRASRQALSILQTAYETSAKEFEEVLRMQQMLLGYELSLEKSIVARYKSEAELHYIFNN